MTWAGRKFVAVQVGSLVALLVVIGIGAWLDYPEAVELWDQFRGLFG